jgi:cobalt/nickel transport protein
VRAPRIDRVPETLQEIETMRTLASALLTAAMACVPVAAMAHFQELIPSRDIVPDGAARQLELQLTFTHPMARGPAMDMAAPARFGVMGPHGREDLAAQLTAVRVDGKGAFRARYAIRRPGDHVFFLEPAPYWESGEGKMIVHYTKVVVSAFGGGEGWDRSVGFPVEIEPLVRPYGVWTGNLFRGIVRKNGKPVAFAEIEVEWRNDGSMGAPADSFVTQLIKADATGAFSYAMPRAGWWGFAALIAGDRPMPNPAGQPVPVELGAVIWVNARDMK